MLVLQVAGVQGSGEDAGRGVEVEAAWYLAGLPAMGQGLTQAFLARFVDPFPEVREEFGVAGSLGDDGGKDSQSVVLDQGEAEAVQDRQGIGPWVRCVFGERLCGHGVDACRSEFGSAAVSAPQAGHAGAGCGRHPLDAHPGVAVFAQMELRGGEYGGIEGCVWRAPGIAGWGAIGCHVPPCRRRVVAVSHLIWS